VTALSTRDALAKALWERECRWAERLEDEPAEVVAGFYEDADALITSGAVVDVETLADDLLPVLDAHRFNKALGQCSCGMELLHRGNRSAEHRAHLATALAAALTEPSS
jgi:hypothetical protein